MGRKKISLIENNVHMSSYPPLPLFEAYMYWVITVGAILYLTICVLQASADYRGVLNLYDFSAGWSVLDQDKGMDVSNFEWLFFCEWYNSAFPWYIGHIVLGKATEVSFSQHKKLTLTLYSLICLYNIMGWEIMFIMSTHCLVIFMSAQFHSRKIVWVVSLLLLTPLNFEPWISWMKSMVVDDEEERWFYVLMYTLTLANIRYTSFAIEKCDFAEATKPQSERGEMGYSLADMVFYIFYFPLFFNGPIITYNLFSKQFGLQLEWTKERVVSHIVFFLRIMAWAFFNEFLLHYLYFGALQQNIPAMESLSLWALMGIGYWQGQFFMNKYHVMFGLPSNIAKIDNFDPPKGPKCIGYIYLYSDMWKHFDRGLYSFLKRYIYIPLGGSRSGLLRQTLGSFCCFTYIFYWHGAAYNIFIWSLLNFIGITLENVGKHISKSSVMEKFQRENISPVAVRRLHASITVPLLMASMLGTFCFLDGHTISYIFYQRLIIEGWPMSWLLIFIFLYSLIQVSMEIHRKQEMKLKTS
ncbi:hypothetical protein ScPMuIL_013564 [Solemya velum]